MTLKTEAQLQTWFTKQLQADGCLTYKFSSPAKAGVPDQIVICKGGHTFFIEYKHPNKQGRLSKRQIIEIAKLRAQGTAVFVVSDVKQLDAIRSYIALER
jgi:hypothetical protein